jgi:dTDP-glucose pyrophosphorylase
MVYDAFVSYATEDGLRFAKAIASFAKERLLKMFVAEEHDRAGGAIDDIIREAMLASKRVIVLATKKAVSSEWVRGEVELARALKKELLVFLHAKVNREDLPVPLLHLKHMDFSKPEDLVSSLSERVPWGIPVIIPAAGGAFGLYPVNMGMPKILMPIGDRPLLHHIVETLDAKLFSRVIVLIKYFPSMVEYYARLLNNHIPIECVLTQGETLPQALKKLSLKTTFLLHYADIVLEKNDVKWARFLKYHNDNRDSEDVIGTLMASTMYKVPVGHITSDEKNPHLISTFVEKPINTGPMGYTVNMAVSLFEPRFLDFVEDSHTSIYAESLTKAIGRGEKFCHYPMGNWKHIQTLGDWYDAQRSYFPAAHLPDHKMGSIPGLHPSRRSAAQSGRGPDRC